MNRKNLVSRYISACLLFTGSLLGQTNVLTQHNDIGRTGQNLTETVLTPANVSAANGFGKLYTATLDGRAWAQPLYVSSVTIGGVNHSVAYVATSHDSVYALDANANGAVLWKASLMDQAHGAAAGAIPDPQSDTGCGDNDSAEYGVQGTPVISYTNATTGTLYVVSITYEGNYPVQRLHALDITSGAEQFGGPVTISASVAGSGSGSVNGVVSFDAKWDNQRPGLLLLNGTVYMGWGSHCDAGPWHGWVMGYNATTLKQSFAYLASPNGAAAGVWMSGAGLAADKHGASGGLPNGQGSAPRMIVATGNGSFDSDGDWAESVLNLNLSGSGQQVTDSFTPNTQASLTAGDTDLGSAGTLILPDQASAKYPHLTVQLSKAGVLYLLNSDNLGGYNTSADQVLQEFAFGQYPLGLWGTPAYFNGSVYFWGANANMQQYNLNLPANGVPSLTLVSQGSYTEPGAGGGYYTGTFFGASPSISANGAGNAIVWANDWVRDQGNPIQYLYAYSASNVTTPLWTSRQNPARDGSGGSQKFGIPTVADGKVFMASDSQLQVYGLLPANFASYNLSAFQPALSVVPGSSASTQITVTPVGSFTGAVTLTASGLPAGVTATFAAAGSGGSTLTLSASSSASTTTTPATVTITGTSGTMSQSIPVSLSVSNTPGPVAVNLAPAANVNAFFLNNLNPSNGGFDTESWAYSANLLGPSISALGVPFYFGTQAAADAVSSTTVPLPAGNFQTINLAGAAANGSQGGQTFVVNYTDGSSTTFTQSVSDWCGPQNYPGETTALSMTYRVSPTSGTAPLACNLYAYSFPINQAKTVSSITLPSNRNVVVLAITLSGQSATTQQAQTITFNALPSQIVGGTLTVSATASSGLPVTFSLVPNGNCSISGNVVTFLNVGNCGVLADQSGNSKYAAAPQVGQIVVVNNPTAQSISFPAIATQKVGTPLGLSASASSGLTVTFASSTPSICAVSGTTANFAGAGTCTIVASQAGNNVYGAATPVAQSFTVTGGQQSQTITFNAIPAQTVGSTLTVNATASSGLQVTFSVVPNGNCSVSGNVVTFLNVGNCGVLANQAGNSNYTAAPQVGQIVVVNNPTPQTISFPAIATQQVGTTLSLSATASSGLAVSFASSTASICSVSGSTASFAGAGTCTITASQAGNSTYSAATPVSQSFTVTGTQQSQTITFNAIAAQTVGTTLTVSASASSGLPVTFSVVPNGNCSVSGNVVTFLNVGNCGVLANQAGNSNYTAAPQVGQIVVVNSPTSQTISFPAIATQKVGTPLNLSASASSGLAVTFTSSTTNVCSVSGSTASFANAGTCTITASQAGNGNYSAATPVSQSFTVAGTQQSQTITFNSIPAQTIGTTLTVSASASSGLQVTFSVVPNGNCSVSGNVVTFLNVGNCGVVANQTGNSTYSAAPAVGQIIVVNNPTAQSISFSTIGAQTVGTSITLSATASSGLTVSFASSTTSVCTVSGTSASLVSAGTCSITASQAGNGTYTAANPVSQSFTVNPKPSFKITASSTSVTVTPPICALCGAGTAATNKITVTPAAGFNSAVSFTVSGLPAGVTAAFNPTTVTGSGSTTLTLTPSSTAGTGKSTTLTVTGSSGSLSASTSFTLNY